MHLGIYLTAEGRIERHAVAPPHSTPIRTITRKGHETDDEFETRFRFVHYQALKAAGMDTAPSGYGEQPPRKARGPVSPGSRRKMAEAKTGDRNPMARTCTLTFNRETFRFPTATAAARHFGTTQQAMDLWLRGKAPWPGLGNKPPRRHNRHLVGLTGHYDDAAPALQGFEV